MGPTHQLHRFFKTGFTAADVAEALVSWDGSKPAGKALKQMETLDFDVAGNLETIVVLAESMDRVLEVTSA